jgi:hypothetical protein
MRYTKWLRFAVVAGTLAGWTAACDFVEPTSSNPNSLPDATIDQLFVASQINAWFFNEGDLSRHTSVFFQQMGGTDRQGTGIERYVLGESDLQSEWGRVYGSGEGRTGGGLLDLRRGQVIAEDRGSRVYAGILKVHEAFLIGMAASIWGDIPYSEAANIAEFPTPVYDQQGDVYAAVEDLLDEAVADLESGETTGADASLDYVDMVFGGDASSWLAVAWTLKARFYMHWVECDVQGPCAGAPSLPTGAADFSEAARNAALNGVASAAGDWRSLHSSALKESNLWYQFNLERSGYISGGNIVFMLDLDDDGEYTEGADDPRLPILFTKGEVCPVGPDTENPFECDAGEADWVEKYAGSPPDAGHQFTLDGVLYSDPGPGASQLDLPGEPTYGHRLVSCSENQLILAEAEARLGNDGPAQTALQAAFACEEAYWAGEGFTIDLDAVYDTGVTGQALLDLIAEQKYIALFLNPEIWNDHKRSCTPALTPAGGASALPATLYYVQVERQVNPNTPANTTLFALNDNDPAACPLP